MPELYRKISVAMPEVVLVGCCLSPPGVGAGRRFFYGDIDLLQIDPVHRSF